MPIFEMASLSLLIGGSLSLWMFGNRFGRRYREIHHTVAPSRWMFTRTDDPELERWRRPALLVLPVCLVGLVLYLFRP